MRTLFVVLQLAVAQGTAPPETSARFWAALAAGNSSGALEQLTDDVTVTLSLDPGRPPEQREVADAVYAGKAQVGHLFADLAHGLEVRAEGPPDAPHASVSLGCERFRRLGLGTLHLRESSGALGDRLRWLRLDLLPADGPAVRAALVLANRAAVFHFFDALNHRDYGVFQELGSPDFVQHSAMPVGPGLGGVVAFYQGFQAAFPDYQFTVEDVVASGDQVAARVTARFTHRGEFMGVAPTGKAVVLMKMDIFRFELGRIREHWDLVDRLGLLQQLGSIPRLPQWGWSPGDPGFR